MIFDMQRVLESKRAPHDRLAHLPVAEKLAMLDALRDMARAIRKARVLRESPPGCGVTDPKD